ncbi:MAG TPA: hypothetical protein VFH56_06755 [Acidimicrobiales bacterium]|nr:hypothetical protein [Acidimicrobiales bacterium]
MSTSTAPDFYPVVKDLPRVVVAPGVTLELLVVAADGDHCAGVDLASGALVRAWSPEPAAEPLDPYDVVAVTLDVNGDAVPDPAEPEALVLAGPPERRRRLSGRRAEKLLRPLLHPKGRPLLGTPAPAVPFWERSPDHPSIALVEPEGSISLWRDGSFLACRFGWLGHERELPCLDRRVATHMDRAGMTRMAAGKGDRLVVSLTPPIDGRCHKVVEAILPRP